MEKLTRNIEEELDKYHTSRDTDSITNIDIPTNESLIKRILKSDAIIVSIIIFIINLPIIVNTMATYTTLIANNLDGSISIIGLFFRSLMGGILFMMYKIMF